jgi:hypothetical protein
MHKNFIDWLRKIHLNPDTALAAKRWSLAEAFEKKATRKDLLQLLRVFLFDTTAPELVQSLTDQFLEIDKEFPASNNAQEVRLMAGIVMVVAFTGRTHDADAYALGIKAAAFPAARCQPAHPDIIGEAQKYIASEADIMRPSDFGGFENRDDLVGKLEAVFSAEDEKKRTGAARKFVDLLHNNYGVKIQRLGEETEMLWWLLGGYSMVLGKKTEEIDAAAYALIAAYESADRTQVLPPQPSIYPILGQAIAKCKATKPQYSLKDFVSVVDSAWRKKIAAEYPASDCLEFVPFVAALIKTEEAGDAGILTKLLPNICPGVTASQKMSPTDAVWQFYNELMFLKALAKLK